jgi:hypothetical protein
MLTLVTQKQGGILQFENLFRSICYLGQHLPSFVVFKNIYNVNIYFKVVGVQIQALECIPKLGRDASHLQFSIIVYRSVGGGLGFIVANRRGLLSNVVVGTIVVLRLVEYYTLSRDSGLGTSILTDCLQHQPPPPPPPPATTTTKISHQDCTPKRAESPTTLSMASLQFNNFGTCAFEF